MRIKANYARALLLLSPSMTIGSLNAPLTNAQDLVLEEIIVTARKREESLQETPIAVSAFSGANLASAGIDSLDDLNNFVPGLDVQAGSGVTGKASVYIRGVGQRNTGVNIDSGIGIYLDGIYISRADGALLQMNDISSVQVLRGPQGTLFGKNTTGGAMVFETNRPSDEFEASLMYRAGNFSRSDGSIMVNVPLGDTVMTRLSATAIRREGYMNNLTTGEKHNDEDTKSAVAQLRWLASEDLTLDLNLNYTKTDQKSRGQRCLPVPGIEGWQAPGFNALIPATDEFAPQGITTIQQLCDVSANAGTYDWTGDRERLTTYLAETKGVSGTITWDVNDNTTLKSITGWRETVGVDENDLDPTAARLLFQTRLQHPEAVPVKTHQITQELQVNWSSLDDKLNLVSGLFYFDEETDEAAQVSQVTHEPILNGLIIPLASQKTVALAENKAWAWYAQADYAFTDNWEVTLGIRYTDEERSFRHIQSRLDPQSLTTADGPVTALPSFAILPVPGSFNPNYTFLPNPRDISRTVSDTAVTPTLSLKYLFEGGDFINGGSAYFTVGRGFLSGGISEFPNFLDTMDEFGNINAELVTFEPEEVTNYELGVKMDAWDSRLRLNAALFHTDYENRQLTTIAVNPVTGGPSGVTINAAESTISGLEIESIILPVGRLQITANVAFFEGEIDEYFDTRLSLAEGVAPGACMGPGLSMVGPGCVREETIDRSDENLPRLPKRTVFLAAEYMFEGSYGSITPRIQWSKRFDQDGCFERGSCESGLYLRDQEDLSARITWHSPGDRYSIAVYGTNLTEEDHIIGGQPLVDSFGFGGAIPAVPRMYGAELQLNF